MGVPEAELKRGAELLKAARLAEAQQEFSRALDLSKNDPAVTFKIAEHWRKAGWALSMGDNADPEAGWTCFHNARALLRKLEGRDDSLAQVHRGLALAASLLGEYEEAVAICREAPVVRSEERAKLLNTQAIALNKLGRCEEAQRCAEEALGLGPDRELAAKLRQSVGVAKLLGGDPEDALPLLGHELLRAWALLEAGRWNEALDVLRSDRSRGHLFRARALEGLGEPRKALAELIRGARAYEEGRAKMDTELGRSTAGKTRTQLYTMLVDLALRLEKESAAFRWAEAGRARSFLDFVLDGRRRDLAHLGLEERQRMERLREEVERSKSPSAERELRMSLRRFEKESLATARILPARPLAASTICRGLGKAEAVVEFHVGREKAQAFVLRPEGCRRVELGMSAAELVETSGDLGSSVALMRRGERLGVQGFFEWHAGELRDSLFGRLGLEGVESLVVVPHGPLHRVPFGALLPARALSLAPSASVHVELAERASKLTKPRTCLLVKDPTETLDHAEAEEAELRERFGDGLRVLAGRAATRDAVLEAAKGHDILHFATHAVYRPERPEFSYLELGEGGRLHAFDVLDLNLTGARLVTLSACDSGRGDEARAGELIGLPRAFIRAGAAAVLATLWPIEDHPDVARLMRWFYAALPNRGPAGALATARQAALAEGVPASIWASLAVIGP